MILNHNDTINDTERALELFTLAAEQEDAYAQYELGNMYRKGNEPLSATTQRRKCINCRRCN